MVSPQGDYVYQKDTVGGTGGGSSGAPLYLASLQVVGQLSGACGNDPNDFCAVLENSSIDGAFHVSFPSTGNSSLPAFPVRARPTTRRSA